jgi:hypothetical protein
MRQYQVKPVFKTADISLSTVTVDRETYSTKKLNSALSKAGYSKVMVSEGGLIEKI